jgi:phage terminase large subunit GpA-like protein
MSAATPEIRGVLKRVLALAALPPSLTVAEWADEYRCLSSESSAKQGKWRSLPWQIKPMEDVTDPDVRAIVLMWASQVGGKTEVINNAIGYFIDSDPSPILMLQPTVEMAESWSKERFTPMLRDTTRLRGKVRDAKSRDANNTILHKSFPGGHLTVVGANAPSGLAMRPIRVVLFDESDRYPKSAGVEGDPRALARKRTESFWDAVEIETSTPTVKGASAIEISFEGKLEEDGTRKGGTDKNYFFVPCSVCGVFQTLKWAQVKFPEGAENTFYECEACGGHWTDEMRQAAIWDGEWRATAPFHGRRGYHLNGIYCLFKAQKGFRNRLHQMVVQFLEAKAGGPETLKTWTNTFLAETWEEEGEQPDVVEVMSRAEAYGPVLPAGVLALVAAGDAQRDRLEGLILGVGLGFELWAIQLGRFMGSPEREEVWTAFDQFLEQEFEHPSGAKLRIVRTFIDSGDKPEAVYRFCKARHSRGVYPIKGATTPASPLCGLPRKWGSVKVTGFLVGTDTAKGLIYDRLKIVEPGPRCIHFPIGFGFDREFFEQLAAEKLTTEFRNGFPRRVWKKVRDRNEGLDMMGYGIAAVENLRPALAVLAKSLAVKGGSDISLANAEKGIEAEAAAKPVAVDALARKSARPAIRRPWVRRW